MKVRRQLLSARDGGKERGGREGGREVSLETNCDGTLILDFQASRL